MKAIITKTLFATDYKPTRIKVQAEGVPHIVVGRDAVENQLIAGGVRVTEEALHQLAARKLCAKYDWDQRLVSGGLPTLGQWVHCFGVSEAAYKNDLAEAESRAQDFERQLDRALR